MSFYSGRNLRSGKSRTFPGVTCLGSGREGVRNIPACFHFHREAPLEVCQLPPVLGCTESGKHEVSSLPSFFIHFKAFQDFMKLLMNLLDSTSKYLRTPKASAEKCTCFCVIVHIQMQLFKSQIMLFFSSLPSFLNKDIIPWLSFKENKVKFPEVPSQQIHTKLNQLFLVTKQVWSLKGVKELVWV